MEHTIGMFGAYERAEAVDTGRKPLDYRTPEGKLLLAVPTQGFDNGTSFEGYALFVFNPGPRDELKDKVWTYVGSILTGDDNSAACADGDVMPCVAKTGKLTFTAQNGSDMPRLTVTPAAPKSPARARRANWAPPTRSATSTTKPARSTPKSRRQRSEHEKPGRDVRQPARARPRLPLN